MLPQTKDGRSLYQPDGEVLDAYFWSRGKVDIIQGPVGCLSGDTEILTPRGWQRIDGYESGPIMVWRDGRAWFEQPLGYVDLPCDGMWRFRSNHALSMVLSDEHRMPMYDRAGRFRVRLAADVAAAPGRYMLPVSFEAVGEAIDESRVRLLVAISADGCFPKRGNQVVVTVRKDRKKDRIRSLLKSAGVEWKEHQHSTRPTELTFAFERLPWMTKRLDMWGAGSQTLEAIVDESRHWDGLYDGDSRYSTVDRENADFMQFAAHATGRRATISAFSDSRSKAWQPIYTVHMTQPGSVKATVSMRSDAVTIDRVTASRKYCFTTSSGFFIARHDGRIFVTGNSGTSTASAHRIWRIACEQEPDRDRVRRTRWIVARTTYKELATTFIPTTWLSWFPESDWGSLVRSEPANHRIVKDHPSGDGTKVDVDVWFLALPDAETAEKVLASFEITGFFYNEAQFVEKGVITELLSRCARYPSMKDGPGATWYGGFLDLNAPVEGHWIPYMRGDLPLPPEFTDEQRAEFEKPESWNFFVQPPGLIETIEKGKIVYQPNPKAENQAWLAETYIEKIRGWDKARIDRRVLNKVGLYAEGKPVYPSFLESEHSSQTPIRVIPSLPIIVGLDFGREPAAAFLQCVNGSWQMLHELIGENESATLFAPKVKMILAQMFPGHAADFWGDPRGADKGQADERTAYQIFAALGMRVLPATTDNNPEMRRSSVNAVLGRRNGLLIDPSCLVCRTGMIGGYHYPKVKGVSGVYSDRPRKNRYSHIVEALENALMGGGEADAVITSISRPRPTPSPARRHKPVLRRYASR